MPSQTTRSFSPSGKLRLVGIAALTVEDDRERRVALADRQRAPAGQAGSVDHLAGGRIDLAGQALPGRQGLGLRHGLDVGGAAGHAGRIRGQVEEDAVAVAECRPGVHLRTAAAALHEHAQEGIGAAFTIVDDQLDNCVLALLLVGCRKALDADRVHVQAWPLAVLQAL